MNSTGIDEQELNGTLDNFAKGLLNGDRILLDSTTAENLSYDIQVATPKLKAK